MSLNLTKFNNYSVFYVDCFELIVFYLSSILFLFNLSNKMIHNSIVEKRTIPNLLL